METAAILARKIDEKLVQRKRWGGNYAASVDFLEKIGCVFQIFDKALIFPPLRFLIGQPEQIGRMHCHQRLQTLGKLDQAAAVLVDRSDRAKDALRGGGAERHPQLRYKPQARQ